jgi:hypothetical protein
MIQTEMQWDCFKHPLSSQVSSMRVALSTPTRILRGLTVRRVAAPSRQEMLIA